MLIAYCDGASSGNPGPMGIGVAIYKDGKIVKGISEYIGKGTNNVAEYTAVIRALETALAMNEKIVSIRSDSELLIKQLNGNYKVKAMHLKELNRKVHALCLNLNVSFEHVPRERNKVADKLSKKAVENH